MTAIRRWLQLTSVGAICLVLTIVTGPHRVVAQTDPLPDVPSAAECTVPPHTVESLRALFARPPASPVAVASPVALNTGTPADPETKDAVHAAIRQLVACGNAGDYWRLLATYSDRYVQAFLQAYIDADTGITEVMYQAYLEPNPPPAERQTGISSMGEVYPQPDGRMATTVVADDPGDESPPRPTIFYLVKNGDRWQIDDFSFLPAAS